MGMAKSGMRGCHDVAESSQIHRFEALINTPLSNIIKSKQH